MNSSTISCLSIVSSTHILRRVVLDDSSKCCIVQIAAFATMDTMPSSHNNATNNIFDDAIRSRT